MIPFAQIVELNTKIKYEQNVIENNNVEDISPNLSCIFIIKTGIVFVKYSSIK